MKLIHRILSELQTCLRHLSPLKLQSHQTVTVHILSELHGEQLLSPDCCCWWQDVYFFKLYGFLRGRCQGLLCEKDYCNRWNRFPFCCFAFYGIFQLKCSHFCINFLILSHSVRFIFSCPKPHKKKEKWTSMTTVYSRGATECCKHLQFCDVVHVYSHFLLKMENKYFAVAQKDICLSHVVNVTKKHHIWTQSGVFFSQTNQEFLLPEPKQTVKNHEKKPNHMK